MAMKFEKLFEERFGKVTAEVTKKITDSGKSWSEASVYTLYKDKDGHWQRSHAFGERDIEDALSGLRRACAALKSKESNIDKSDDVIPGDINF